MRPCFGCTKEMLQAGVKEVYYLHDWTHPDAAKQAEYTRLQGRFAGGIRRLDMDDPRADWAITTRRDARARSPVPIPAHVLEVDHAGRQRRNGHDRGEGHRGSEDILRVRRRPNAVA